MISILDIMSGASLFVILDVLSAVMLDVMSNGMSDDIVDVIIGPSGVRALPLAAGINVGGHYFR